MAPPYPLRVAFRVGQYPALTETFIVKQMEGLAERGHIVSVLADSAGPDADDGDDAAFLDHVQYIEPRHRLLSNARSMLPYRIRKVRYLREESRWAQEHDVIICHFGWSGSKVAESVRNKEHSAKIVAVFHGDDVSRAIDAGGPEIYEELFEAADILLPVSDFWRRRLVSIGAPEHKTFVHHMGVDVDQHHFQRRPDPAGRPFRFVSVGRLVEKKGAAVTLHALRHLADTRPEVTVAVEFYGDGPLAAELDALCSELGLDDRVRFHGSQSHTVVTEALENADAFVLPSLTASDGDMEGIPVSIMEAMASGLPVVSTCHSGIPELIEHGINGLLCAEGDVEGLAAQLATLATRPDVRERLARAARRTIEGHFDNRVLNDQLDTLLRSVVAPTAEDHAAVHNVASSRLAVGSPLDEHVPS